MIHAYISFPFLNGNFSQLTHGVHNHIPRVASDWADAGCSSVKEASRGRNPSCQGSGALPPKLHCSALWSKLPRLRCSHNTPLPRVAPSEQVLFSEKPIIFLEAAANLFTCRCNLGCSMNSVHISPDLVNNLHQLPHHRCLHQILSLFPS